jgi:CRP-like cAMP-binding protein
VNSLRDFKKQLKRLLLSPVTGLTWDDKLASARIYMRELESRNNPEMESMDLTPDIEIVPFEPGRRPVDEALGQGLGVSEHAAFLTTSLQGQTGDELWLLYHIKNIYAYAEIFNRPLEVRMGITLLPPGDEEGEPIAIPGLGDITVPLRKVSAAAYPVAALEDASLSNFYETVYAATLDPEILLPRHKRSNLGAASYLWNDIDPALRARTPDGDDPFTFAHMFHQRVRVNLSLVSENRAVAQDHMDVELYDAGRFGSLYARLLEQLVIEDTATQIRSLGISDLHAGYHPWFPVLTIGMDKALLYLHAIRQDLGQQRRNLPDPVWLVRVGLYLELLTCLGIFEAVKDEYPNLLTPAERRAFEHSPAFAKIREKLDVTAWQKVWALRKIVPRSSDLLSTGPVSVSNLMRKQKATLAFLHAHHDDLKNAIALAGPNLDNAQETWHRVFRDAERAVLRNSLAAFPELGWLDNKQRDFAMWHQRGLFGSYALPESLTGAFGDQDGVFPSACRQYRKSMNEVAAWAREKGLMDHTGNECIPRTASLLEAQMRGDKGLIDALQRRDGYGSGLETDDPASMQAEPQVSDIAAILRRVPVFKPLTNREVNKLAGRARRVIYGPHDRIVIQGDRGASLFVVEAGFVEVLVRQTDGQDIAVATLEPGAVFGEAALLTGVERTATVRSIGESILYEISKQALQPIIESRPQLVVELSLLMASRQNVRRDQTQEAENHGIASRIRSFFLGGSLSGA